MAFDFENQIKEQHNLIDSIWDTFTIKFDYKPNTFMYKIDNWEIGNIIASNNWIQIILSDITIDNSILPNDAPSDVMGAVMDITVNVIFYKTITKESYNEKMRLFRILLSQCIAWPTMVESYTITGQIGKIYNAEYIYSFLLELSGLCLNAKHITLDSFNWKGKNLIYPVGDTLKNVYINNSHGKIMFYSRNLFPKNGCQRQRIQLKINENEPLTVEVNENYDYDFD